MEHHSRGIIKSMPAKPWRVKSWPLLVSIMHFISDFFFNFLMLDSLLDKSFHWEKKYFEKN